MFTILVFLCIIVFYAAIYIAIIILTNNINKRTYTTIEPTSTKVIGIEEVKLIKDYKFVTDYSREIDCCVCGAKSKLVYDKTSIIYKCPNFHRLELSYDFNWPRPWQYVSLLYWDPADLVCENTFAIIYDHNSESWDVHIGLSIVETFKYLDIKDLTVSKLKKLLLLK